MTLNQTRAAATAWRELLESQCTLRADDWGELARFLAESCEFDELGQAVLATTAGIPVAELDIGARLCALRCVLETSFKDGPAAFVAMDYEELDDPDLALDFAAQGFRLGRFELAGRAAAHAGALSTSSSAVRQTAGALEASCRSFAGDAGLLVDTLRLPQGMLDVVLNSYGLSPTPCAHWGVVRRDSGGKLQRRMLPVASDGSSPLELCDPHEAVVSFSLLPGANLGGETLAASDPLRVLPEVDFELPHLMVVIDPPPRGAHVHGFVGEAGFAASWAWRELRVEFGSVEATDTAAGAGLWRDGFAELQALAQAMKKLRGENVELRVIETNARRESARAGIWHEALKELEERKDED